MTVRGCDFGLLERNVQPDAAQRAGQDGIHSNEVVVTDQRDHATGSEPHAEQVGLSGAVRLRHRDVTALGHGPPTLIVRRESDPLRPLVQRPATPERTSPTARSPPRQFAGAGAPAAVPP